MAQLIFKKKKCTLGQDKIFGATCLTQDSNQNGQEHFWQQFQKVSLKTQKSTAIFLYVVKPIDDRGDPLKSAMIKWLQTSEFSSQPYETATRSAPDYSDWSPE